MAARYPGGDQVAYGVMLDSSVGRAPFPIPPTGIAEFMGSNTVQVWTFFSGLNFTTTFKWL